MSVQRIEETREVDDTGTTLTSTTRVDGDRTSSVANTRTQLSPGTTLARIVWFVAGVLLTLLTIRFVLVLLGANASNDFAHFIYSITRPFVSPFFGLFNYSLDYGKSHVELATIVAMIVYALIASGIARLVTIRHPER